MSKAQIGDAIRGFDVANEFLRRFRIEMEELKLEPALFHRLTTDDGRQVVKDMARVMQEAWGLPTYNITIDYTQTIEEMVAAGNYNDADPIISSRNFGQEITAKKGVRDELEVVLLHLDREATSQEALAEMERIGLRPATLVELLMLGVKYPELQREFPIVALGSSCVLYGYCHVAYLWSHLSERGLSLFYFVLRWRAHCRFLAVRK